MRWEILLWFQELRLAEFECPKPKTGVLCCNCKYNKTCPPLHPPKPNLRPRHSTPDQQPFQPIPDEIAKWQYRTLLLVADNFSLTKAEVRDMVFYSTRFFPFARNGGRGKSWERVYALLAIELLRRDKRLIYKNRKIYFDGRYQLRKRDTRQLKKFVKGEIRRLNKTIPSLRYLKRC